MSAGGVAGVMTCPLDVVKTRIQTQINPPEIPTAAATAATYAPGASRKIKTRPFSTQVSACQRRPISTSSPSTTLRKPGAVQIDTSSVLTGLRIIYKTEGIVGLFRGVGPRAVWTSVQSGTMLVLYQALLKHMAKEPWLGDEDIKVQ